MGDEKETDTVISTLEFIELFEKLSVDFVNTEESQTILYTLDGLVDTLKGSLDDMKAVYSFDKRVLDLYFGSLSNPTSFGYAEFIMNRFNERKFGGKGTITRNKLKNSDFKEIHLKCDDFNMSFALVYGFRNIKSILANKKVLSKYSYVEIMACPGGCVNGGGQMRIQGEKSSRDVLAEIEAEIAGKVIVDDFASVPVEVAIEELQVVYKKLESDFMINFKW